MFIDPVGQMQFLEDRYLGPNGFLPAGGSKVKFVTGRPGSGKSAFLAELGRRARTLGYQVSYVDARTAELGAVDDLYRAIVQPVDLHPVLDRLCRRVIVEQGADPAALSSGANSPGRTTFVEWSVQQGRPVEIVRREVKMQLERLIFKDPHLDRVFSLAVLQLAAAQMGALELSPEDRVTLDRWFRGVKLDARERRTVHLRLNVDRSNARLILRSWLHLLRLVGIPGHVVTVDNFDVVLNADPAAAGSRRRFTRARREDIYEVLRQFIDEIDQVEGLLLVLSGRDDLFNDSVAGLRSYPALWMRVQNEVLADPTSGQVNRFLDIIDLDHLWQLAGAQALEQVAAAQFSDMVESLPQAVREQLQENVRAEVVRALQKRDLSVSPVQRVVQAVKELARRQAE
ncbi:MAG: DUF2791 family P-loop domain-containing protein [Limnochordaceae bacterium]|nr:DUF2791 family P-loop domain-containing protein [Limnochordaceae bacterium]